jgi:hypothetical protein
MSKPHDARRLLELVERATTSLQLSKAIMANQALTWRAHRLLAKLAGVAPLGPDAE